MNPDEVMRREVLAPEPAEGLAGVLDIELPDAGTLPPLWHWVYLLDRRPQQDLGDDGHPTFGIPAPPGPGRRRMFAGGRLRTHRLLRLGEPAVRTTRVLERKERVGRSGPLTFVTVRHEITQDDELAVVDDQDLVYRGPGSIADAPTVAGPVPEPRLDLHVDSALLFRFSALTYNAHRIHYDRDYARDEGYEDLVVHGPLQALVMAELLRRHNVSLVSRTFAYRLTAPMIGPQRLTVAAREGDIESGAVTFSERGVVTARGDLRKEP
ncbi:MAG: mesaconyl-C4 CoA hydratase [Propionibacteriales bacterium]|nr:mesaconyl-C4 CoA hydratase [Propionibacteriales bacterium]